MDEIEHAQQTEQRHRDAAIRAVLVPESVQQNKIGDQVICRDCDTEIPWERIEANPRAYRCVGCQALHEEGLT